MLKKLLICLLILVSFCSCGPSPSDELAVTMTELVTSYAELQAAWVRHQEMDALAWAAFRVILDQAWLQAPDAADPTHISQSNDANCIHVTAWDTKVDGKRLEIWHCWLSDCLGCGWDWKEESNDGYWELRFDESVGTITL